MSSGTDSTPSSRSSGACTDGRRDSGFALLLVIWVLAILAVLAVGLAATTRSNSRLARNLVAGAQARALAEAGVARAEVSLLDPDPAMRWPADGTPQTFALDGGTVLIRIQDEGGKVDLNAAPPELISGLCRAVDVDGAACSALVDGVTTRRQAASPAPSPMPQMAGFMPGAAQSINPLVLRQQQKAAFSTVEELRQLPGVDRASLDRLRPFLTVYSQSPRVDPMTAPREVLLAVPGIDPHEVERLLATRDAPAQPGIVSPPPSLTGVDLYVGPGQLRAATIIARATIATGASFTRRAVVALTGIPLRPVQVLEWRQEMGTSPAE